MSKTEINTTKMLKHLESIADSLKEIEKALTGLNKQHGYNEYL